MTDDAQTPPYDKVEFVTALGDRGKELMRFADDASAKFGPANAARMMILALAVTLDDHLPGFLINYQQNASLLSETGESDQ